MTLAPPRLTPTPPVHALSQPADVSPNGNVPEANTAARRRGRRARRRRKSAPHAPASNGHIGSGDELTDPLAPAPPPGGLLHVGAQAAAKRTRPDAEDFRRAELSEADRPPASVPRQPTASSTVARTARRWPDSDLWIRVATVAAVLAVAAIAATVSYHHMRSVALDHGEDPTSAAIIPISVDGLIIAASMTLLADSRAGRRRTPLSYFLLVLSSAASIAANVMHAEPTLAARVIAAWPSAALIGAYELLMSQIRATTRPARPVKRGALRRAEADETSEDSAEPSASSRTQSTTSNGGTTKSAVPPIADVPAQMHPDDHVDTESEPTPEGPTTPHGSATPAPSSMRAVRLGSDNARLRLAASSTAPRPGTKRARLATLLASVTPDDPRSDYALAKDLGPIVDLHTNTARRYIVELRSRSRQPASAA